EPGSAIIDVDASYTQSTLETGPAARALASTLWPGALIGDGMGTITEGQIPQYPLKADARYPDKPYTDTAHGCLQADQPASCVSDGGAFMSSQALGLDVKALARMNPADVPGVVDLGGASSLSTATVKDGVAIGTSVSRVTDVELVTGVIKIGSVSTSVTVKSDGIKPVSSGSTVVSGLTIGGVGYVVDENGARPVGAPAPIPGSGPLPTGAADPAKEAGITISGISQESKQDVSTATRDAKGLRITIDTVLLRSVLNQVPSPVTDALVSVFSQAPKEAQGYLFYLLTTTPKLTFVLGAGSGVSAATLPLSFDFPDFPTGGGIPLPPPAVGGVTTPTVPITSPDLPVAGGGPPPVTVPGTSPTTTKAAAKDPFGGLSPGLLLLVLALAGVGGWGLVRLQSAALLGAAAAGRCATDTSPILPDLRGA
ncbi:MAG TPA: choice-of-anchor P family protein, partial [Mycobacteriales bacterium]|nr:choice-of-anchor P family protein [Mycobacteriales bacterium]